MSKNSLKCDQNKPKLCWHVLKNHSRKFTKICKICINWPIIGANRPPSSHTCQDRVTNGDPGHGVGISVLKNGINTVTTHLLRKILLWEIIILQSPSRSVIFVNWPSYTTQQNTFGYDIGLYWKSKTIVCSRNTKRDGNHTKTTTCMFLL